MRTLRVSIDNGNTTVIKSITVQEGIPVGRIVRQVCEEIGIANAEEYSLVVKKAADTKVKASASVRKRTNAKGEHWLDHTKTLEQQDVNKDDSLLLRKKYFFSDQDINWNDPVQVNIVYAEAKQAVLSGVHPCTLEEAIEFGAMQLQVELGDFSPQVGQKYPKDLSTVVPPEYCKVKGIEKRIAAQHTRLRGYRETNVKYQYVSKCRSLNTYGMTFFTVKEKVVGKTKTVTRILGISREGVYRLEEGTKKVLQSWPLTTVRRWAATSKSFTLDFGEYAESYYTVQTTEGNKMSQLLAGYVDIILGKKKRQDGHEDDDVESAEVVTASASAAQVERSSVRRAVPQQASTRSRLSSLCQTDTDILKHFKQAAKGVYSICQSIAHLEEEPQPDFGDDMAASKHHAAQLAYFNGQITAVTGSLMASCSKLLGQCTHATKERVSANNVGATVAALQGCLQVFADTVAAIKKLSPEEGRALQSGAAKLSDALVSFVENCPDAVQKKDGGAAALVRSAGMVASVGATILEIAGVVDREAERLQESLAAHARNVTTTSAKLVSVCQDIGQKAESQEQREKIHSSARNVAVTTSHLATAANLLAYTLNNPLSRAELSESAQALASKIAKLVGHTHPGCQGQDDVKALGRAAQAASESLAQMLGLVGEIEGGAIDETTSINVEEQVSMALAASETLRQGVNDAHEVADVTKAAATATAAILAQLKELAFGEANPTKSQGYLMAARSIGECMAGLVSAAKEASSTDGSTTKVSEAASKLQQAIRRANALMSGAETFERVGRACEGFLSIVPQSLMASSVVSKTTASSSTQREVSSLAEEVQAASVELRQALGGFQGNPQLPSTQLELFNACKAAVVPAQKLAAVTKRVGRSVQDPVMAAQLGNISRSVGTAVAELNSAVLAASSSLEGLALSAAEDITLRVQGEVDSMLESALQGKLKPLPGDDAEQASRDLAATSNHLASCISSIRTAIYHEDTQGIEAETDELLSALKQTMDASRAFAACSSDIHVGQEALQACSSLVGAVHKMVVASKDFVDSPTRTEEMSKSLLAKADQAHMAAQSMTDVLPGFRELGQSVRKARQDADALLGEDLRSRHHSSGADYAKQRAALSRRIDELTHTVSALRDMAQDEDCDLEKLAEAIRRTVDSHEQVLVAGCQLASQTSDAGVRDELMRELRQLSDMTTSVLFAAKGVAAYPEQGSLKEKLLSSVQDLTSAMNGLLDVCATASPAKHECENALRVVRMAQPGTNATGRVSDKNYLQSFQDILDSSATMGAAMPALAKAAKDQDINNFCKEVGAVSSSLTSLSQAASQAAFLAGTCTAEDEEDATLAETRAKHQRDILAAGHEVNQAGQNFLIAASAIADDPTNSKAWQQFASGSKLISAGIKSLAEAVQSATPGVVECGSGVNRLAAVLREVDQAQYSELDQLDKSRTVLSEEGTDYHNQLVEAGAEARTACKHLVTVALTQPEVVGDAVSSFVRHFEAIINSSLGAALSVSNEDKRGDIFDHMRTSIELGMQVMDACRSDLTSMHSGEAESVVAAASMEFEGSLAALQDVVSKATDAGHLDSTLNVLAQAMERLHLGDATSSSSSSKYFGEYQEELADSAKTISRISQDIVSKAMTAADELPAATNRLCGAFSDMISVSTAATSCSDVSSTLKQQVHSVVRGVGESLKALVAATGPVQADPNNSAAKRELARASRGVAESVSQVMATLKAAKHGTQACIAGADAIESKLLDLETTTMFAEASSLVAEGGVAPAVPELEAKLGELSSSSEAVVSSAATSQSDLAEAAAAISEVFAQVSEMSKGYAGNMPAAKSSSQVLLLNAARDVGASLRDLLVSARDVSSHKAKEDSLQAPAMAVKSAVSSLREMLAGEQDAQQKLQQAVESAIDAISGARSGKKQSGELQKNLAGSSPAEIADSLLHRNWDVTQAASKLVNAMSSGSSEQMMVAAHALRKSVLEMMVAGSVASQTSSLTDSPAQLQHNCDQAAEAAEALLGLIAGLKGAAPDQDLMKIALDHSKAIAAALTGVSQALSHVRADAVDLGDPSLAAEEQLLNAAKAIEAAVEKLSNSVAQVAEAAEASVNMEFNDAILGGTHSIAQAASSLMQAASEAQTHLVDAGLTSDRKGPTYSSEASWSANLVSAAKVVVHAMQVLCSAANAALQGNAAEEKLAAAAQQVANSTAHLLMTCMVKVGTDSPVMVRLQAAGNSIKAAADKLVKAAHKAGQAEEESVDLDDRQVSRIRAEFDAMELIARQERELEMAKKKLANIRASRYKKPAPGQTDA